MPLWNDSALAELSPDKKVLTETIERRVEWLRCIGLGNREIKKLALDRQVDDLVFQVLVNELTRKQGRCSSELSS